MNGLRVRPLYPEELGTVLAGVEQAAQRDLQELAAAAQLDAWCRTLEECWPVLLASPQHRLLVCEQDGEPVSAAWASLESPEQVFLSDVYSWQPGTGAGLLLLAERLRWATSSHSCTQLATETVAGSPSVAFWAKLGVVPRDVGVPGQRLRLEAALPAVWSQVEGWLQQLEARAAPGN